jgi:ketol-acid reductoisomerase
MTTIRVFSEGDADRDLLAGKRVAVLGYGSQGQAHALNLHDSGIDVVVGLRADSVSRARATQAGLQVSTVPEAAKAADVVSVLITDMAQPAVYRDEIAPHLAEGAALLFAHGFNIHYGQITPPESVDVIMAAPKAPGATMRSEYQSGRGVPALIAVHQDATGSARGLALAYADAIGCTRAGVLETTFAAETETDLFGEQTVLCGGVSALIKAGFETLVEAGYPAELAYFECLHELKLIVDLIQSGGLRAMRAEVSDTAEFGDYVSGPRVVNQATRQTMRGLLDEIRSGAFARRWIKDGEEGNPELARFRKVESTHPLEVVGERLRARMAWLQKGDT